VNLELLNGYVLVAIVVFAICLYIAMVAAGFNELVSRLPKTRKGKKSSRNLGAARRSRNEKRLPYA
jgi:hypothetical protein